MQVDFTYFFQEAPQCGNLHIFTPTIFCKNSVKSTFTLESYTVNQFDEKILQWGKISEITTLCKRVLLRYSVKPSKSHCTF